MKALLKVLAAALLLGSLTLAAGCGAGSSSLDSALTPAPVADEDISSGVAFNGPIQDEDNSGSAVHN